MTLQTPEFLQTKTYSAQRLRNAAYALEGEGIVEPGALIVSERGAGANMSVDVAAGVANVRGDDTARQGLYRAYNDAVINAAIGASHATLPRIDRIVLQVNDSTVIGSSDLPAIVVVAGTPTAGADLDDLLGVAAVPNSAMLLAEVLVGATVTTITSANIRDRRPVAIDGILPPKSGLIGVRFLPALDNRRQVLMTPTTGHQYGLIMHCPARIEGATKIRIQAHNAPTANGSFRIGIYTASGRKIVESAVTAFATPGVGVTATQSVTIPATTLDPGLYFVVFGSTSSVSTNLLALASDAYGDSHMNSVYYTTTGGTTLPDEITPSNTGATVPAISLTVG
jgi:hypothetical protein